MSEARNRAVPDEVLEKIKQHTLDTVAAMVSGSQLLAGRQATRLASEYGGEKISTVVGSRVVCGPIEAALINGLLAHADETNDVHRPSRSQPGSSVVPAALAVGEKFGINGMHFLRAVVLGYDIGPRVTIALGPSRSCGPRSQEHLQYCWSFRRFCCGRVCGGPKRPTDALASRLRCSASFRHRGVASGH